MPWKAIALVLAGIVALLAVVAYLNRTTIGETFGPSCTVGITDTAAQIEVKGWNALSVCDELASQQNVYRFHGSIIAPPICEYSVQDIRYTVHDQGVLNLVGSALCQRLQSTSAEASAGQLPSLDATPQSNNSSTFSTDVPTPTEQPVDLSTPTPSPADTPTPIPTPSDPTREVIGATQAYHLAAHAAYGPDHDDSQVDQTMTGTARDAILCVMRNRSDSLLNTGAYLTYQELEDRFGPVNVNGDSATVVENKHEILTLHKRDGRTTNQDNSYSVTYTLTRSSGSWLVSDYSYVSSTGFKGSARIDAKPCGA